MSNQHNVVSLLGTTYFVLLARTEQKKIKEHILLACLSFGCLISTLILLSINNASTTLVIIGISALIFLQFLSTVASNQKKFVVFLHTLQFLIYATAGALLIYYELDHVENGILLTVGLMFLLILQTNNLASMPSTRHLTTFKNQINSLIRKFKNQKKLANVKERNKQNSKSLSDGF